MTDIHEERTMAAEQSFHMDREDAADQALQSYDFGGEAILSEIGHWTTEEEEDGTTVMRSTLYLETDVDGDGRLSFKVKFPQDSVEPSDVVALSMGSGREVGQPGGATPPAP